MLICVILNFHQGEAETISTQQWPHQIFSDLTVSKMTNFLKQKLSFGRKKLRE